MMNATPSLDFGGRLRMVRGKFYLNQGQLADLLSYSRRTVNRIERGLDRPSPEFAQAFQARFNCNLNAPNFFAELARASLPESLPEAA